MKSEKNSEKTRLKEEEISNFLFTYSPFYYIIKADIYICLNYFLNHHRLKEHFCFSADMCGGKTPYKRKPLFAVFKGAWVVLAGVECSPKIQ